MIKWIGICLFSAFIIFPYSCKNRSSEFSDGLTENDSVQADLRLIIHLRGADKFKITLFPLTGARALSPIRVIEEVMGGGTDTMVISKTYLPGEFNLTFDCLTGADGKPVHFNQYLIISAQSIEIWINPLYGNDPDSTWFQQGETENNAFRRFVYEAALRNKHLPEPHDSMLSSVRSDSGSLKKWIREYERRRVSYNNWINKIIRANRTLFLSEVIEFEKFPGIEKVSMTGKNQIPGVKFLNEIDFSDPVIIRTSGIYRWMDGYVKRYEKLYKESEKYDSMLVVAGKTAIERIKSENSLIYGWMVGYFYDLYEKNNNMEGIIALQSYLEDDKCLTSMKLIVLQRSEAMKNIIPDQYAPDFQFINEKGFQYMLNEYKTSSRFKLLLFWNTGCMNCLALTDQLYEWYQDLAPEHRPAVFAVNLDELYDETVWRKKISEMPGWEHMIDKGGIDSEVANAYGILYTPEIILIDSKTGRIVKLPQTIDEIGSNLSGFNNNN